MMTLHLSVVTFDSFAAEIRQIRQTVFQVEQQVDPALDFDGLDSIASHILASFDQLPVGTTRIRLLDPQIAKIERVAVLPRYRGQGVGRRMIEQAIWLLTERGILEAQLHAQIQTVEFYQKLGFLPQGEPFYEAGIPHMAMSRACGV